MKDVLKILLALALGAAAGFLIARSTPMVDPDYWVARAEYARELAEADLRHRADRLIIDTAREIIAGRDAEIAELLKTAAKPSPTELAKDREIAALEARVEAYEAQGDLAAALAAAKAESAAWAEKFSLAVRTHKESVYALNKAWQAKFDAQVDISESWKRAYEDERALRIAAEGLSLHLEKKAKLDKYARYGACLAAFIIGNLSGRK